jgi:hypothetical protein
MPKITKAFMDGFYTFSDAYGLIFGYITKDHAFTGYHADKYSGRGHKIDGLEACISVEEKPVERDLVEQVAKGFGDFFGLTVGIGTIALTFPIPIPFAWLISVPGFELIADLKRHYGRKVTRKDVSEYLKDTYNTLKKEHNNIDKH